MADIFDDVDTALQRDRMLDWWQKNGNAAIGLMLAVLVGVGVNTWWQTHQRQKLEAQTVQLLNVLLPVQGEAVKPEQAEAALKNLQANGGKQLDVLAALQLASRYEADGRNAEAVAVLEPLLQRRYTEGLMHDLAVVQYARLKLALFAEAGNPADKDTGLKLLTLLEPVTARGRPFRHTALELKALIDMREAKLSQDPANSYAKDARAIFTSLSEDEGAPATLRQRAQAYLLTEESAH